MSYKKISDLDEATVDGSGFINDNDLVEIEQSGVSKKATKSQIGSAGNVVGPAAATAGNLAVFDGTTGKLIKDGGSPVSSSPVVASLSQGRLTTESSVPISTSDRTLQSTIYFTPYIGNHISIYSGTQWVDFTLSEISLNLSALTSNSNYDVFIFSNSGTLTLELSVAWLDDYTPIDVIALQDGVSVKSSDHTKRWIGTIRTTSTTTTEDSQSKRFVWNAQNQVTRTLMKYDVTDNHIYSSGTWREWNGGVNGPHSVFFVSGEIQQFTSSGWVEASAPTGAAAVVSFQLNSTTTEGIATSAITSDGVTGTMILRNSLFGNYQSVLGLNRVTVLEIAPLAGSPEFSYYRLLSQIVG